MQLLLTTLLTFLPLILTTPISPRAACTPPTSFQINSFGAFTAAPGPTGVSFVAFTFLDSATGIDTSCERQLPPGSGRSPEDPDHYYACNNTAVHFLYGTGNLLSVRERFTCNGAKYLVTGNTTLSLDCIPTEPPIPSGFGTLCDFPVLSEDVTHVNVTRIHKHPHPY
ncbi:hypothetical protein MMC30_007780 [Trapelia coarctata]|nr:hypothetical protein [Trapelia coarctata]